jgi:uncharacterized protein YbcI
MPETQSLHQSVPAKISDGVGRVVAEYTGRGPTSVRTSLTGDLVITVMRDTFTKAERKLVKDLRLRFQQTMRDDLIAVVTRATGREVEAFFSDHHIDPDIAVETFILVTDDHSSIGRAT